MTHPHKDILNKWMDDQSIVIEWNCPVEKRWKTASMMDVFYDLNGNKELRVKPEPKPDVVQECKIFRMGGDILWNTDTGTVDGANIRLHYDGETGKLKSAEVL